MDWDIFKNRLESISENDAVMLNDLAVLIDTLVKNRIDKKISQQRLSQMTGITQSAIARFEACGVIPRIDTVIKIANALDCRITIICEPINASDSSI